MIWINHNHVEDNNSKNENIHMWWESLTKSTTCTLHNKIKNTEKKNIVIPLRLINLCVLFLPLLDGPTYVHVNIFVRSISKIDDVTMVSFFSKTKKKVLQKDKEFMQKKN